MVRSPCVIPTSSSGQSFYIAPNKSLRGRLISSRRRGIDFDRDTTETARFVLSPYRRLISPSRQMLHADNRVHPDLSLAEAEDYPAAVVAYAGEIGKGTRYEAHCHRRAQLFHIV